MVHGPLIESDNVLMCRQFRDATCLDSNVESKLQCCSFCPRLMIQVRTLEPSNCYQSGHPRNVKIGDTAGKKQSIKTRLCLGAKQS